MRRGVLLGSPTYTKPYNLFLALPLGVEPLSAQPASVGRPALRVAAARVAMAALSSGSSRLTPPSRAS